MLAVLSAKILINMPNSYFNKNTLKMVNRTPLPINKMVITFKKKGRLQMQPAYIQPLNENLS